MAGTYIKVESRGEKKLAKTLKQLAKQSDDLTPALADIGEYLLQSIQQRFVEQQAPDGSPWEELSSTTLELKTKQGQRTDRILTESGTLADTIHYQLTHNQLTVGSNAEYAAMHQFGGLTSPQSMFPNQDIPARPFLGLAPFERAEVEDIISSHLMEGL